MSQDTRSDVAKKEVLYTMPGVDLVTVRRDQTYKTTEAGPLTMDVYYPPDTTRETRLPAIVFVTGFSDLGARKMIGCSFKEMGSYVSWARLVAASGMAGVTYTNREPEADVHGLLGHLRTNAAALGIDGDRIGIWACSGNGPVALSILMNHDEPRLTSATLCYAYTMDLDGSTGIARAAAAWRFVNAAAGKSVDDLRADVPLFLVRAGKDAFAGVNDSLDRLLAKAVARNLPIAFANHPEGPHAFDLDDDSDATRAIIEQILTFMRRRSTAASA